MSRIKRILAIFGILLLLMFGLVTFSIYRGFTGGRRIDVTRLQRSDHPLFAGEKREDNSVDYLAAIERITSDGVKEEENFGIAVFELAPDDSELNPVVRKRYAGRLNFNSDSEYRFHTLDQIVAGLDNRYSKQSFATSIGATTRESFTAGDESEQMLREVLAFEKRALDRLLMELDQRPKYYVPLLKSEETDSLIAVLLPHAQHQRQFARWLASRADQSMADDDLPAAWRDIRGVYQIGNRVSQGFTLIENLVGVACQNIASEKLKVFLNSPQLTKELVDQIALELPSVTQIRPWTDAYDKGERAMMLNTFDLLVEGKFNVDPSGNVSTTGSGLPFGWVDSVQFADDWNRMVDRIIAATKESPDQTNRVFDEVEAELKNNRIVGADMGWLIAKALLGAAPKREGTKLAETLYFGMLTPAMQQVNSANWRHLANARMLQLAVAVRQYEFANGRLPKNLEQLENLVNTQVMIDPCTGKQLQFAMVEDEVFETFEATGPTKISVLRISSAGDPSSSPSSSQIWQLDLVPRNP